MSLICDVCGRERSDTKLTRVPSIGYMCTDDTDCKADLTKTYPWAGEPADYIAVDRTTLADIETVLRYVSRGRGYLDVNYAYPDKAALRALATLEHTAGASA